MVQWFHLLCVYILKTSQITVLMELWNEMEHSNIVDNL
jgi:hypothetical protein